MTDFAKLVLLADTKQPERAVKVLDQLGQSGERTERRIKSSARGQSAAHKASTTSMARGSSVAAAANDNMARSATVASRAYTRARANIVAGSAAIAASVVAAFSVRPLFEFSTALAEVSTLVDTASFDMEGLAKSARSQSAAYGGGAAAQTKAFYAIISAGASSAAEANETLTASNKLAVGGVTGVAIAADGLTSVLNAYGDKVEGATAVSDALFVAMRAGKTTIGELSGSLGKVAPLAAQTGVSFDELAAGVSALTKGGIATTEAVTGVRAILAAVAKPTKEAADMAKSLGLEFNAAGLKSKGFQGFIEDLVDKTNGSTEALSQLFGGVEALVPVMALSGQAGKDFSNILDQMADKAGQTQLAFDKMANSPAFQAGRVWSSLNSEILGVSGSLSGPLATGLKAVADNMGLIITSVTIFTAGHLAAAIVPVIAQIASLTAGMSAAAVAARALSVAMAFFGGPIGLAVTGLAAAFLLLRDNVSQAEAALAASEGEYQSNISLLNQAKSSSEGYTAALRNQIAMQVQVAKANEILAGQKFDDAVYGNSTLKTIDGLYKSMGAQGFQPYQSQLDGLNHSATAAADAAWRLEQQLAEVDANMKTVGESSAGTSTALTGVGTAGADAGKAIGGAAEKAVDPWKNLRKVTTTYLQDMKSALNDFGSSLGGIFKGLTQGTIDWKEAAISALNSVLSYMNKMNVAKGGQGIFGGGFFQSLLSGFLGFAGGTNYAPAGLAVVGEKGPEVVNFRGGEQVIPNHRLGAVNNNNPHGANSNTPQEIVVRGVFVDDNGVVKGVATSTSQQMGIQAKDAAIGEVKKSLPQWSRQIKQNGSA